MKDVRWDVIVAGIIIGSPMAVYFGMTQGDFSWLAVAASAVIFALYAVVYYLTFVDGLLPRWSEAVKKVAVSTWSGIAEVI